MKSPAKISENRFLGGITSSSFRNLLPRSISTKQKPIQNPETKIPRSDDENAIHVDPNIQSSDKISPLQLMKQSPPKLFPSATQIPRSDAKDGETLANFGERIEVAPELQKKNFLKISSIFGFDAFLILVP